MIAAIIEGVVCIGSPVIALALCIRDPHDFRNNPPNW